MMTGEMPWAKSVPNPPREPGRILILQDRLISKGISVARDAVVVDQERIR